MSNENHNENEDLTWLNRMESLKMRMNGYELDRKVRKAISDYYAEKGIPEPNWRRRRPYFDADGNIVHPED